MDTGNAQPLCRSLGRLPGSVFALEGEKRRQLPNPRIEMRKDKQDGWEYNAEGRVVNLPPR